MDIILRGQYDAQALAESLIGILEMLHDKYHVEQFREIQLQLRLVDTEGYEVELIDSHTKTAYRFFEVFSQGSELTTKHRANSGNSGNAGSSSNSGSSANPHPPIQLVIDNTK